MSLYTYESAIVPEAGNDVTCKIIAHRGYFAKSAANTIAAFIEAVEDGFKWLEIDVRITSDGHYVMAHDASISAYLNGVKETGIVIANRTYADLKQYTLDAHRRYPISSLQAVFTTMRQYDVHLIIDMKTGSRSDIIRMASAAGMEDRIMLSYGGGVTPEQIIADVKYHPTMPLRIYPRIWANLRQLQDTIPNPIYLDVNAASIMNKNQYQDTVLCYAIASGLPILFSGCNDANAIIWIPLAGGAMHENQNVNYEWFRSRLVFDSDKVTTIASSETDSVTVAVGGTASLTAESSLTDDPAGYLFVYTKDPSVAVAAQDSFGDSITYRIVGVSSGNTELVVFDASGSQVVLPVTVTAAGGA